MVFLRGTREEALQKTPFLGRLYDLTEQYASLIERQIERLDDGIIRKDMDAKQ